LPWAGFFQAFGLKNDDANPEGARCFLAAKQLKHGSWIGSINPEKPGE
jgi:hypothetical protein